MKLGHVVVATALVSAGLLATGCGSSSPPAGSKTAAQVIPAMEAAMRDASSVHIVGTFAEGSQKVGLNASLDGSDFSGTVVENGASFTIVVADGSGYELINASYLKEAGLPATDCSTVCGKYLQLAAPDVAKFTASFTMSAVMSKMVNSISSAAAGDTTDLFKPATFQGHPVLRLVQAAGDTCDVARTGTPYPLFISNPANGTGAAGGLVFSEWNSVPPVMAPPPSQIAQT